MDLAGTYTLLGLEERSETGEGHAFPTGRRTRWDFVYRIPSATATTVEVEVETSPTGENGAWTSRHTFTTRDGTKAHRVQTYGTEADFQVEESDLWIRANVTALSGGEATMELVGAAPFFDARDESPDLDLLSQKLASWDGGRERIVAQAEADVLEQKVGLESQGRLPSAINDPAAAGRIRRAIQRQAEWEYQKHRLRRSNEASAMVTLREMGDFDPGVDAMLAPVLDEDPGVWLGR